MMDLDERAHHRAFELGLEDEGSSENNMQGIDEEEEDDEEEEGPK